MPGPNLQATARLLGLGEASSGLPDPRVWPGSQGGDSRSRGGPLTAVSVWALWQPGRGTRSNMASRQQDGLAPAQTQILGHCAPRPLQIPARQQLWQLPWLWAFRVSRGV